MKRDVVVMIFTRRVILGCNPVFSDVLMSVANNAARLGSEMLPYPPHPSAVRVLLTPRVT